MASSLSGYWIPAYLQDMKPYLEDPNSAASQGMYGMWDAPDPALHTDGSVTAGEGGVDLDSPTGTPVYALADGPVVGVGYWRDEGHGVVTIRCSIPGYGSNDMYYQHIIFDPNLKIGSQVARGQTIGTIGQYGEIEIGLNARWGQPWGPDQHPGAWAVDPRPQIAALMALGAPGTTPSGVQPGGAQGSNALANIATAVLQDVGVPAPALQALSVASPSALTWIGGGMLVGVAALGAGVLLLLGVM